MEHKILYGELMAQNADKLPYMALIELAGYPGPLGCRERNMLNIMTKYPEMYPMDATPSIVDKGQSIYRGTLRHDGAVGTIGSIASLWSFPDARILNAAEVAKLMGHDVSAYNIRELRDGSFRKMLGLSLHVATAGLMMTSLLASLAHSPS